MIPSLTLSSATLVLFDAFAAAARSLCSFGAGPLVLRGAGLVGSSVLAVDGSRPLLDAVAAECRRHADWVQPHLVHADIGPVNPAGHPTDRASQDRWPLYQERIWAAPGSANSDLFLAGGRFRVACVLQTLLRCRPDAVLLVQTYRTRREYHGIAAFAREIAGTDELTAFVPRHDREPEQIEGILDRFRLVTS